MYLVKNIVAIHKNNFLVNNCFTNILTGKQHGKQVVHELMERVNEVYSYQPALTVTNKRKKEAVSKGQPFFIVVMHRCRKLK